MADAVMRGRSQRVKIVGPSSALSSPNAQPQAADKLSSKKKSVKENKDAVPKRDDTLSETGNAFQMLVNVLPRSLTEKPSGKSGETKQQAERAVTTSKRQAKSVAEIPLSEDAKSAPIRVILVFQRQLSVEAVKPE